VEAGSYPILSSAKMSQKKKAACTAWMNPSISLLGNQLILNMYASAQRNDLQCAACCIQICCLPVKQKQLKNSCICSRINTIIFIQK
jgi:hypothetical protein